MMKYAKHFETEEDGFRGSYYPLKNKGDKAFIEMLGDNTDDYLARGGVKWLHRQSCSVMTMSPDRKDCGHHNYPLERIERAVAFLKENGYERIGIIGLSATGMVSLAAAAHIPDITLTVALSPSDFIMEGFYQDRKDGMYERPGDNESSLTWRGEPLPYLPYAYRHPDYWRKIREDTKKYGDLVVARPMFDESEEKHPIREEEKIRVENIRGHIIFCAAEDDMLWDSCKYIRRMTERLGQKEHGCTFEAVLAEHGTHFLLPEGMMKILGPKWLIDFLVAHAFKEAKEYKQECRETRTRIDKAVSKAIREWR